MNNTFQVADWSAGRMRLRIAGEDRVAFLHGQCTNEIKQLKPGESCYAAFLNAKGKMRGDGHIVCLDDVFLCETSAGMLASLEKFIITEDVTIEDLSTTLQAQLIVGSPGDLPADVIKFAHPFGLGILTGQPLPVTMDTAALLIEAGIPRWGVDMDENMIPVEAGLTRAISYDKGCYIGQETIARIKTYGHVNRQSVQLALTQDLPARGEKIVADGREVGAVTSSVMSVRLGKAVALGYVRRELAVVGTKLTVGNQEGEILKLCGT